jgi:hypothetical protein
MAGLEVSPSVARLGLPERPHPDARSEEVEALLLQLKVSEREEFRLLLNQAPASFWKAGRTKRRGGGRKRKWRPTRPWDNRLQSAEADTALRMRGGPRTIRRSDVFGLWDSTGMRAAAPPPTGRRKGAGKGKLPQLKLTQKQRRELHRMKNTPYTSLPVPPIPTTGGMDATILSPHTSRVSPRRHDAVVDGPCTAR